MILFVVGYELVDNALRHREILMPALIFIEHTIDLLHVEVGTNRRLRRADTVVVVHFEVDEQLPVAVCAAVLLQRERSVRIPVKELVELGTLAVAEAHTEILLGIFLSGLAEVPILVRHIVCAFGGDLSALVFVSVLGRIEPLLVLLICIILCRSRKPHRLVLRLFPLASVERNDEVDAVVRKRC